MVKARFEKVSQLQGKLEPIPVPIRNPARHPINRAAAIRQSKGRWYTTHSSINASVRRYFSTSRSNGVKFDRSTLPASATRTAITQSVGRAPFASTLRPNLTGGALPRTAGGYGLGSGGARGARYFSHTPAAPAQVVNNVSAAVRAFWLSGQKAQFDGMTPMGEKRYRTVSTAQEQTSRKMQSISKTAPGSFIDFHVNPTVTALSPLGATFPYGAAKAVETPTLNTEGFLDVLSIDFARALKELAVVMNDLKRLSSLGDLPISLEGTSTLRVRFPGCDARTVESLCDEVGIQRGIVHQDADFDDSFGGRMALLFPFASTSEHTLSSPGGSLRSQTGHDEEECDPLADFEEYENPWLSSPEGYETMEELSDSESLYFSRPKPSDQQVASDSFEGLEGIYRFIEQCDNARRVSA